MPTPKSEFPDLYPCDFYTPAELLDPDQMYTVYEIARLLQELDPDAEIDEGTEDVLLDWAIPWVMTNADDLVVAEPRTDEEPGYYGLKPDATAGDDAAERTPPSEGGGVDPSEGEESTEGTERTDTDADFAE